MKITKKQLRKIIKEYYPIGGDSPSPSWKAFQDAAYTAAAEKIEAGMEADGVMDAMKDDVEQAINDIESEWMEDDLQPTGPSPSGVRGDIMTREDR